MKTTIYSFTVLTAIFLLLSSSVLHAEIPPIEEPTYDELLNDFHKSKADAFEQAKTEGKYVFLFAGRPTCASCKSALKAIQTVEVQSIIEDSYIPWYIDWDYTKTNQLAEGRYYYEAVLDSIVGKILPITYIIDPEHPEEIIAFDCARNKPALLLEFLDIADRPVSNETITVQANKTYITNNTLFISTNNSNETITVYSITGQIVASFQKKNTEETLNTKSFPKGVLIIKSSAGWTNKLINE